jgi:peptide-methionine (S)-S-oxide reductase
METATFGAGCFWGVQAAFDKIDGVIETTVGYAGGVEDNPTYELVCSHTTKHVEVVEVKFDPSKLSYEQLVREFFALHDPTQENRQGPDVGWQYRSVIFTYSNEQRDVAEKVKNELNATEKYAHRIATSIESAPTFWRAEEYHQKYIEKGGAAACHI